MAKTAAISVRVEPDLKRDLEKGAQAEGRPLASYVERVLVLHHRTPAWRLRDPHPINREEAGPQVALPIADGWPVAVMPAEKADKLGKQLVGAAEVARKLPPAE